MRVWLYARLSNDDDREMNSLLNQREVCQAFAEQHGYIIMGQSFDDNISGMSFDRRGLDELMAAVDADKIDAVIVKDLSRLGRHRTQTALFIDYLREHQVRVISATEGVDTFRDEDDLIIGVRGLMNDYYAKDIGKKDPGGIPPEAAGGHCDHTALRLLERQKYGADQDRRRGGGHGATHLFSVLAGLWAERDRPAAQRCGAKDTGAAPS